VREKHGDKLLFVFNLTREAQDFRLPDRLSSCMPIDLPGFTPGFDGGIVRLAALDAFCARV
jgi:alpha-glucosidase